MRKFVVYIPAIVSFKLVVDLFKPVSTFIIVELIVIDDFASYEWVSFSNLCDAVTLVD